MESNEVDPNDKLLGTTSGYPIWDNTHDKSMRVESTSKCNITKKIEETLFWGVKVEFLTRSCI